jgi:hypothetical protein
MEPMFDVSRRPGPSLASACGVEERSETEREDRRDKQPRDATTATPGMGSAPRPHQDDRDPAHAGSKELRDDDTLKGGSTGG